MRNATEGLSELGEAADLTREQLHGVIDAIDAIDADQTQYKSKFVENRSERRKREQVEKAAERRNRRGVNRVERIMAGRVA